MAGIDIRTVQELMGHQNMDMTLRYAHLSPNHKQAAMEMLEDRLPAKSPVNVHDRQIIVPTDETPKVVAIL